MFEVFFLIVFNYLHWTRAVRASKRLHERLINRLLQAPMAFFDTTPLGRIMNRVSSDMEIVGEQIRNFILIKWAEWFYCMALYVCLFLQGLKVAKSIF